MPEPDDLEEFLKKAGLEEYFDDLYNKLGITTVSQLDGVNKSQLASIVTNKAHRKKLNNLLKKSLYPVDDLEQMRDDSSQGDRSFNSSYESIRSGISNESRHTFMSTTPGSGRSTRSSERHRYSTPQSSPNTSWGTPNLARGSIHPSPIADRSSFIPEDGTRGPNDNGEQTDDVFLNWMIGFAIILLAVLLCWYYSPDGSGSTDIIEEVSAPEEYSTPNRQEMLDELINQLGMIRLDFPSQTKRFWATIGASSKSLFRTEFPPQPGVILLAASTGAVATMECITGKVSEVLTKTYRAKSPTVFDVVEHQSLTPSHMKLKIDETFQAGLGAESHVAILHRLEKIPGHAAMMFHAYCDNESAPYKDAVIIFTMRLPLSEGEVLEKSEKELQHFVESFLQDAWQTDIGYDNTMALKSRIANAIGIVKAEQNITLSSMGC